MLETFPDSTVIIRPYQEQDERSWLRCSVLSFLDTAYFDSVFRRKPRYDHPAIELVAELKGTMVGVIDLECEDLPGAVCTVCTEGDRPVLGAMIWHLAVHPDYQRQGIGRRLLDAACTRVLEAGIVCLEAWTRDDAGTLRWYEANGFEWVTSYLHVYMEGKEEVTGALQSSMPGLTPVHVFAHYTGEDRDAVRARFARVHECNCFRRRL
jgi:ribosomal protein S18 acetylase RimI-like enzyme